MRRYTPLLAIVVAAVSMATSAPRLAAQAAAQANATPAAAAHAAPATTIIFVRHAEAAGGDPRDPSLSPAGEARAQALSKALQGAGISAIYTSQFQRTRATGDVVAKATGAVATVVPVAPASIEASADALIARIVREHPGGTVLVVGHSNTVPVMVSKAASVAVDALADTEFDRMFVVTIRDGVARVIKAKY